MEKERKRENQWEITNLYYNDLQITYTAEYISVHFHDKNMHLYNCVLQQSVVYKYLLYQQIIWHCNVVFDICNVISCAHNSIDVLLQIQN